MSLTEVNISGSLTVNGQPISVNTGSLVTTASFNAYTSSVNIKLAGLDVETGSLQLQINQKLNTGSFNSYTSSNDSKVNSLIASTGSYATTSSLTALSQSIASTDLSQDNRLGSLENKTGSYATTGSNQFLGNQAISGSLTLTGPIIGSQSIFLQPDANDVRYLQVYNTSPTDTHITASGGQIFLGDDQTYVKVDNYGSVERIDIVAGNELNVSSSIINITGSLISPSITGSLQGTASYATNALSASYAPDNSNRNGLINTGSIGGSQSITGSLGISGTLTALSASITYLETVYETASIIYSSGSNQFGDASNDTQTLWGRVEIPSGPVSVTGSVIATNFTGSLQGTASYATQALSASYAPQTPLPSGLVSGSSQISYTGITNVPSGIISGSVQISDLGFATTSSVNTKLDTGSFNTYSGNTSNLINTKLDTGSFNAYTSSNDSKVNALIAATGSYITETESGSFMTTGSVAGNVLTFTKGDGSQFNLTVATGSGGGTIDTGSFATTGSNIFIGNQTLTGSFNQTGSMNVIGNPSNPGARIARFGDSNYGVVDISNNGSLTATNTVYLTSIQNWNTVGSSAISVNNTLGDVYIQGKNATGSVYLGSNTSSRNVMSGSLDVRGGSFDLFSNNTTINTDLYLTSSQGQSNTILGWSDNPGPGGAVAVQANFTGSLKIDGSNNTVSLPQIRGTNFQAAWSGYNGYISGSHNVINGNNAGIYLATGSLLFPKIQGNIVGFGSAIGLTFTSSSLSPSPIIQQNTLYGGQINIIHNSGSATVAGNLLNTGQISSTQNFVTNVVPQISANMMLGGTIVLNHISSSIITNQNFVATPLTVNNHVSSSITNNSVSLNNNMWLGGSNSTGPSVWVSGSQSSNVTRAISDNLVGGRSNIISSSFVSSSNSNLFASLIFGQNLIVSGNHATTGGGSAFVGRFNDTGSLSLANDIVFAVGTGTSAANRRTGLWIDSGSVTNISGSLSVKGVTNALTVTGSATIQHSVFGQPSLTVIAQSLNSQALNITGSLDITGSATHNIAGTQINITGNTQMSGNGTFPLQVNGTAKMTRLHFVDNPFNSNVSSNLGAIRMAGDNQTLQYTNYDIAQIATQSFIDQYVNTGSLTTQTRLGARYAGTEVKIEAINNNGTRSVNVLSDSMTITGSLNIAGLTNSTGSYFVTTDDNGLITRATSDQVLPALFDVGYFYSTTTQSGSANTSGSYTFDNTAPINEVTVSGSRINIPKTAWYNFQFSIQAVQGSGAADVAVWLKKNGGNVTNTATYVTIPSNHKSLIALNIWEQVTSGSYVELAYQSDSSNTTYQFIPSTGNIPGSPSVIMNVNQVR
jgi:hypothetical protein